MPRSIEFSGIPRFASTWRNHFEPGMAPSRAKAQVLRDAAVTQPTPHMRPRISNGMWRQKAPAEFPTADLIIVGTGWPEARLASMDMSGRTKQMGIRKARPARKLSTIPPIIALGTWMAGWRTSSHILLGFYFDQYSIFLTPGRKRATYEVIIPDAERPYAAWSKPIQKDQPSGHPDWGSNPEKTHFAERLPCLATASMVIIRAVTPAKVQNMAKVYMSHWVKWVRLNSYTKFKGDRFYYYL